MPDFAAEIALPDDVPGASIAVVSQDRIEWSRGFGVLEAGSSEPVTTDTLFQACSISKAVTAVAVLRLVQEGALRLDEDVNSYLISWKVPQRSRRQPPVTIRALLSHTAGVNFPWSAGYHREQEVPTLVEILNGEKPSNYPAVEVVSTPGRKF
ncbi:MAG: beta-lactamase family protein, partial [Chloroflexota bacterium]|nr:beta-lactamase family protein [Chloroflexota bacterium]